MKNASTLPTCRQVLLILTFNSLILFGNAQTFGNATYNRLSIVSQFHTRDFDVDPEKIFNDYMTGIIAIPYLIAVGFFIALLIFEIALCCRWCCDCCRCITKLDPATASMSITAFTTWAKSIKNSRNRLICCFFFFIFICLICCAGFVVCRSYFVKGSDKMLDAADVMYDITLSLEDSGDDLNYLGEVVVNNTKLSLPTCPEAEVILNYTYIYLDSVAEYNEIIDPIPGDIDDLRTFAEDGSDNIQQGLWSIMSIFTMICMFNVFAYCMRKRILMRVCLAVGLALIHITLVAWAGSTVMLLILSDFCMTPTTNAISLSESSVEDMAYYYGTCNGTNPIYAPIASSLGAVTALSVTITTLSGEGGDCEDNPYLVATYPAISGMFGNISFIEEASDCPPIQNEWANLYNEAFCHSYFIAIYTMFWTLTCLLIGHYLLMITSSLISQYFDEYWETGNLLSEDGPTALNANLLHSAAQLQPDGSLSLASAEKDPSDSHTTIRYSEYATVVPPIMQSTPAAIMECGPDSMSFYKNEGGSRSSGSRESLHDDI